MKKPAIATLCATSFLFGSLVVVPGLAMGRPQDPSQAVVTKLEFNGADVRDALRDTLRGHSYRISPDVQGTVTIALQNVSLDVALQNITRQVDAKYVLQNGVYEIYKVHAPVVVEKTAIAAAPKAPARVRAQSMAAPVPVIVQDNDSLYILRGNNLTKVNKYDLKIEKSITLPMTGG